MTFGAWSFIVAEVDRRLRPITQFVCAQASAGVTA